ncbi:hypothetical protein Tco_0128803 [Tanacetum coccineum]
MSLSLAENVNVVGDDNRPPMLNKTNYSSWACRMLLYIIGKEHGKLLVDSVLNEPFQYGTMVEPENETTPATIRARTYTDLTDEEKIHESVDIKATNIVLQGLPQDIYNLVNHNEHAKEIWDRVKLLIQGLELSLQERESKLYDDFDTFTSMPGETIHSYYMRQHEAHANEVHLARQRYPDQIALVANSPSCLNPTQYYPQLSSASQQYYPYPAPQRLVVPSFNPFDDPITNLNKLMAFVSTPFGPRFPQTNNQLRNSSNPRNQATIQDGRVTVQTVQGRQTHGYANNRARNTATNPGVNRKGAAVQPKALAFLANNGDTIIQAQASQEIPNPTAFQTNDLDAFGFDCDDVPSAKAVLMANLSSYDLDVLSECSKQPSFVNDTEVDITSDSNIISYEQYLQEIETLVVQSTSSSAQQDTILMSVIEKMSSQVANCNKVQQENIIVNETLTAELERYKEQVKLLEQRQKFDLNDRENYIDGQLRQVIVDRNAKVADFEKQIHSLKLQLNATVESHKTLSTTIECLKKESKQKEDKYLDETHAALSITDTEQTLELAEDSRLKMLAKQNNRSLTEKKVKISPIDYVALNKLAEHFVKHFVPQKQLSAEQAYWLPISHPVDAKPPVPSEPALKKEIPRELPLISLVKDSFHKMKEHVNKFDETITFHTKITGNKIGSWGVEHIKGAFEKDVKPFAQTLQEYFRMFEYGLNKELKEMKAVFNQMETDVAKCSVDKKYFEIEKKKLSLDNDRLLEHIICQDIMNIVMHAHDQYDNVLPANNNSLVHDNPALDLLKHENDQLMELLISQDLVHTAVRASTMVDLLKVDALNSLAAINDYKSMEQSFVDEYEENLKLQIELDKKNDLIEKAVYNELSKQCSRLENRCIYLEIKLQRNKERFQNNRPSHNQDAPEFKDFFS